MPIDLNAIPNSFWTNVVLGSIDDPPQFLAIKIALTRLRGNAKKGPSEVVQAAKELREVFVKYMAIPQVSTDLGRLLGNAGIST